MSKVDLRWLRGNNNEGVLLGVIVLLAMVVGFMESSFWSSATLVNVLSASMENMIFAMAVLLVIISGGIDVSFMAIAIFAGYSVVILQNATGVGAEFATVSFLIAGLTGMGLGLLNAIPIASLRLPTLIVTLGTQGIIRGSLIAFVGAKVVSTYPDGLEKLSTSYVITVKGVTENAPNTQLHVLILPAIAICVFMHLLLTYTKLGRGVYAVGGDAESARRTGFPVFRVQVIVYTLAGLCAGIGGMMHVTQVRLANPYELVGGELDVIAAVVLGGASIFGGKGSVGGTVLGVVLISLIKNSLILLGIPSTWQRAAVGILLIIGVGVQALAARARRVSSELVEVAR